MPRKFNFGAGPATMPESVLTEVQEELLDWNGLGLSVMEISHRSPEFIEIAQQAELDFRDLLSVTDDYAVLFTHGGATMQNAMVPLNLASPEGNADYVNSGHWAKRSIKEAERYTNVHIAASSEEEEFKYFPSILFVKNPVSTKTLGMYVFLNTTNPACLTFLSFLFKSLTRKS